MNKSIYIIKAAEVIADIDPKLANLFKQEPFKRDQIITAFHQSLNNCNLSSMADELTVFLRSMVDKDRASREI